MPWKDYEDLDITKEVATSEELEKLRKQYGCVKEENPFHEIIKKGGQADRFKKKYPG